MKVLLLLVAAAALAAAAPSRKQVRADAEASARSGAEVQISGGSDAAVGQFPWTAYITMDGSWVCGGSLVSDSFVLTAAQCASGYAQFLVMVGEVDTLFGGSPYMEYGYTYKAYIHEGYEEDLRINDIALIEVLAPFTINDGVAPVNLPKAKAALNALEGKPATVTGWGAALADEYNWDMESVTQPIMNTARCSRFFGNNDNDVHICADGEGGASACGDDLGGPLVIQEEDGSWKQVGISSFESDMGCVRGYPSVYTRVSAFVDWIGKYLPAAPATDSPSTTAAP
ncbi:hypothetical protein ONE63_001543 [Megalurothrips usitatus]|uniref:Peptidase S1 domain-containing protein n=1 Tax=Megalurothrips usitatus TaxID=439358 RepID=A0AAV7XGT9_9NEOP|nr:hypothetical protein ONE63_001543 [Megalurothrips usitatus]